MRCGWHAQAGRVSSGQRPGVRPASRLGGVARPWATPRASRWSRGRGRSGHDAARLRAGPDHAKRRSKAVRRSSNAASLVAALPFWLTSRNSDYHHGRRTRGPWTPPTRRVSRAARHDPARKITHQPTPQVGTSLQRMIAAKKRAAHRVRILSKPYPRGALDWLWLLLIQ